MSYKLGEVERPLQVLAKLNDQQVNSLMKMHPWGYVTYARLLAKAKITNSPAFDPARFQLLANNALAIEEYKGSAESEVITRALAMP